MIKVLSLLMIAPAMAFSFQVSGTLYRYDTREVISGAAVVLKMDTNIIAIGQSGDNGSFGLSVPAGNYSFSASAAGYFKETREISVKSDMNLRLYLVPQSTLSLGEVEVVGEKLKGTESKNNIDKSLREKATTSITGDPMHSMMMMPGVKDLGFSSGNTKLSVRGGTGNENLALLDEALVQYPYHHFLPDSVFIDDIVGSIALYKGVIPAEYGQALSSLLEVNSDEGKAGFHGKLDIGLLNSYLTVSGATEDQKWNYIGGIRRTYYDLILPFFVQNTGYSTNINFPYYLDSHGRVRYQDVNDTLSFVWQFSTEPLSYTNLTLPNNDENTNSGRLDYLDGMVNLDWKHLFSHEWYVQQTLGTMWDSQIQQMDNMNYHLLTKTEEQNVHYRLLAGYAPVEELSFKAGGEIIYYPNEQYTNYASLYATNSLTGVPGWYTYMTNSYKGQLGVYSLFLENNTDLFNKSFYLQDGLRFNYVDMIHKMSLDPRVTAGWRFSPENKLYAAVGYLSEFPTDAGSLRAMDFQTNLDIPACWHYVLGAQLEFLKAYSLSVEGYYKNYVNYLTYESNTVNELFTAGEQRRVYGADILLTKKADYIPLYGWVSLSGYIAQNNRSIGYASSAAYGQSPARPPINQWFDDGSLLYKLDITVIWDISKNFSLTSEFQWQAGAAFTPLSSVTTNVVGLYTSYLPVWGNYNSARLPDVHSLNLKVDYYGTLWDLPVGAYIQVNNVYNYRPVTGISYINNYSQVRDQISPIGIYPELGVWLKW